MIDYQIDYDGNEEFTEELLYIFLNEELIDGPFTNLEDARNALFSHSHWEDQNPAILSYIVICQEPELVAIHD